MDTVDEDPNQEIGEYEENDTNAEGITQEYEDKNGNKNAIEVLEEDAILYIVVSEKEENIEIFNGKEMEGEIVVFNDKAMTEPLPGSVAYIINTCIWYLVLGNKFVEGLHNSNSRESYFSYNISGKYVYD